MADLKNIAIDLNSNSYEIKIGDGLISNAADHIKNVIDDKSKVFIITDENVAKIHLGGLSESLASEEFQVFEIVLPAGESTKSFDNLEKLLDKIFDNKPERKSTLIALGGGVIGDLTGFAGSILLRGVNFIQIPTTLLAMVDSSVGGKTGINNKFGKNLVGSFYQPKLVLADTNILKTLLEREFLAGYAEVVKYGLINDREFFEFLEREKDFSNINYMIEKSCSAKADIVAQDEKEKGQRALLNLGHTFGHALEALCGYDGRLLHGEAVAIGMILAFEFSEYIGLCPEGRAARIRKHFQSKKMRTEISELGVTCNADDIINIMYQDKKVSSGNLVFILAKDVGESIIYKDVNVKKLKQFLEKKCSSTIQNSLF